MKKYKRFEEQKDLNELVGELKGKYKSIAEVKKCKDFKALSASDKEYVIDELKADGMK
jgi:hypothetical protein